MRSSTVTRGFRAFSTLTLAGVSVLVFHTAALAQQDAPAAKAPAAKAPAAKDAAKAPAQPAAEPAPKEQPNAQPKEQPAAQPDAQPGAQPGADPMDMPPEYGPPPGYRRGPPPPPHGYPPPAYGPYYDDNYYGPPAYPTPPRRYYRQRPYQPAPVRYYPEPVTYRTFFFGIGLGVGGVALFPASGNDQTVSRSGMSYNMHFGFGVSPRWSVVLSGDGAFSYFNGYDIDQSVWSIGPQVFITRHLYARAGVGVATKSIDSNSSFDYYAYSSYTDSGMGWTAALGWEFMQSYHSSLGLEAGVTLGHYQNADLITGSKDQGTIGLNFMLKLF